MQPRPGTVHLVPCGPKAFVVCAPQAAATHLGMAGSALHCGTRLAGTIHMGLYDLQPAIPGMSTQIVASSVKGRQ